MTVITWGRTGGYECSSKGDKRFSALFAQLPGTRTIEMHYQCDVKGYAPGLTTWRLGKGKPPLLPYKGDDLYLAYKALWAQWGRLNLDLMEELYAKACEHNHRLSDCFAHTPINQARALSELLTEWSEP